jgi:hypothetical protein
MSKKFSVVLILCVSSIGLSGCSWLGVAGPCFGVGCPASAAGHSGQYKLGEAPKAQNAQVPAQNASAPAQTASSTKSQNTAATQSASRQSSTAPAATAQPAAAPNASAEAKPSPMHSVGEFFTHLLPHHSSSNTSNGANAGASN